MKELQEGYYHLYPVSNENNELPLMGYAYYNSDANSWGFGFNIVDGGGFLPITDLAKGAVYVPLDIQEQVPLNTYHCQQKATHMKGHLVLEVEAVDEGEAKKKFLRGEGVLHRVEATDFRQQDIDYDTLVLKTSNKAGE